MQGTRVRSIRAPRRKREGIVHAALEQKDKLSDPIEHVLLDILSLRYGRMLGTKDFAMEFIEAASR
jgi:hypothetical protein